MQCNENPTYAIGQIAAVACFLLLLFFFFRFVTSGRNHTTEVGTIIPRVRNGVPRPTATTCIQYTMAVHTSAADRQARLWPRHAEGALLRTYGMLLLLLLAFHVCWCWFSFFSCCPRRTITARVTVHSKHHSSNPDCAEAAR